MNIEQEFTELKERVAQLETAVFKTNIATLITKKRDTTRYIFNGKVYPKNKLVFAVVCEYIKNNNCDLIGLKKVFDKSLQGSLNVVEDLNIVKKIKDYSKRYFCKQEHVITLSCGVNIVVCTQWTIFNIMKFIKYASSLGFDITEIKT